MTAGPSAGLDVADSTVVPRHQVREGLAVNPGVNLLNRAVSHQNEVGPLGRSEQTCGRIGEVDFGQSASVRVQRAFRASGRTRTTAAVFELPSMRSANRAGERDRWETPAIAATGSGRGREVDSRPRGPTGIWSGDRSLACSNSGVPTPPACRRRVGLVRGSVRRLSEVELLVEGLLFKIREQGDSPTHGHLICPSVGE